MATYKEIQDYVRSNYGFVPKTCWIAHVKEMCGVSSRKSWNRIGPRSNPCPKDKVGFIRDALKHFSMI
jgi:hypothetical protein